MAGLLSCLLSPKPHDTSRGRQITSHLYCKMNFYKIKTQQKNNEIDTLLKGRIFSAAKKAGVYTDFTWFFVCLFVFLKGEM